MQFSVDVYEHEVPGLLGGLLQITGEGPWLRRQKWLLQESDSNSAMVPWLRARCALEWAMGDYLARRNPQDRTPIYELIAFAAAVVRCHSQLSGRGQNRLRGMLIDGLKEDKGLLSVQHEMTTAVHLMSRGYDVEFLDIDGGGGVDFVAHKRDVTVEIECKMFSADLGRKIHQRRCATFFKACEGTLQAAYQDASEGVLIVATLPDRLTPSPTQHQSISQAIASCVAGSAESVATPDCTVRKLSFRLTGSPFAQPATATSQQTIAEFVPERSGVGHPHIMMLVSPGRRAVVLVLHSAKRDAVIDGIRRQLRDAAVQFSRTRPGIIAVQLHDLSNAELLDLGAADGNERESATSLQLMTADLLQSPSRAHIHTIYFVGRGAPVDAQPGSATSVSSGAYSFATGTIPATPTPPSQSSRRMRRGKKQRDGLAALLRQPPGVGVDVDHRHGAAELQT